MSRPVSVLLAEDDDELRFILSHALVQAGYRVSDVATTRDLEHEIEWLRTAPPEARPVDIIVSDVQLASRSALKVLSKKHRFVTGFPVVLITSDKSPEVISQANRLGVAEVLSKPFDISALLTAIEQAILQHTA